MEHQELRCLCDYVGGAQLVNTWQRPAPAVVFGELETDERGEIVFAEIWSPVTVPGIEEELRKVIPIVDGIERGEYVSLSGIRATVMAPPRGRIWAGALYTFGKPLDPTKTAQSPLANTTIKYRRRVSVGTMAGPTVAITQPFRVRLWGYVYKADELPRFGSMTFPYYLTERARQRTVWLEKVGGSIPINADTWLTLPGGKDQSIPKINPFVRYAYNLAVVPADQSDYQFRLVTGGVTEEEENMYWEYDDKDALFVEGLGVKGIPGTNMARTGLRIDGNYHPKGQTDRVSLFPTSVGINELNYGHLAPFAPVAHPYYAPIPKLISPYLIWNEIGMVVARSDGVGVVAANTLVAAITGIRLELRA